MRAWRWAMVGLIAALASMGPACGVQDKELILATTTSTQDSGLLEALVPAFEKKTGYEVKTVAVGSGAAMQMGERGDADVLLVHSPFAEEAFVAAGQGIERARVMYNDFVLLGPASDPAGVHSAATIADAMRRIYATGAAFFSRGDDSGTHAKEKGLWATAGLEVPVNDAWYSQTGQGMGATLTIAAEKDGYTLSDRATWLARGSDFPLGVVSQGDGALLNVYHVIVVNPATHQRVNVEGARAFRAFLLEADTQAIISAFGADQYGQSLFVGYPD